MAIIPVRHRGAGLITGEVPAEGIRFERTKMLDEPAEVEMSSVGNFAMDEHTPRFRFERTVNLARQGEERNRREEDGGFVAETR